jgi:hypothetical protein
MIMFEAFGNWCERYGLNDLLLEYPGLRLRPTKGSDLVLAGIVDFSAEGPTQERIEDSYKLEIRIPKSYPAFLPQVWETAQRIPASFHKLQNGSLCLGAETRLRLMVARSPSIKYFVDAAVVPYLYGHSYFQKFGKMPFGELSHGRKGIIEDLADLFGTAPGTVVQFVTAASLRKRVANKLRCPCGKPQRVGRCHHNRVNALRQRLGRAWFRYLRYAMSARGSRSTLGKE